MTEGGRQKTGVKEQKEKACPPAPVIRHLKRRADFLLIARQGKKWAAPGLVLQTAPSPQPILRLGLTASSVRVGNAVARNRARRRLRALAQEILPLHAARQDYVLIARETTVKRAYGDLKNDLIAALKKTGTWRDDA